MVASRGSIRPLRRVLGVLVVVALTAVPVVAFEGQAGATDNPIVGSSTCTIDGSGQSTCTFTGTVNGVPYTGTLDDALMSTSTSRACATGDPRVGESDGLYVIYGGTGVFSGVRGYGSYSEVRNNSTLVGPLGVESQRFGGPPTCGSPIPLPIFPPVIAQQTLPDATLGQPYHVAMTVSEGVPPYRWRVRAKNGKMPRGLRIDKATGVIAGTPKRLTGTFHFYVEVLDAERPKHGDIRPFSIVVHG